MIFKSHTTVTIIGAGQTGIAAAYFLKKYSIPYILLDAGPSIGHTWLHRYQSLKLDSLRKYSRLLKKYPFPGDPNDQPTKDEVVSYLQKIVCAENLKPLLNHKVLTVTKSHNHYSTKTNNRTFISKYLIIATGAFYEAHIPFALPNNSSYIHSKDYQNPLTIPRDNVTIIGSGNSAVEIARELLDSGKHVTLSSRNKKINSLHNNKISQWIAYVLGVAHVPFWHPLGLLTLLYTRGKSIGDDAGYISQHPHFSVIDAISSVTKNGLTLHDQTQIPLPDFTIWATGYRPQYTWLNIENIQFNQQGEIKHLHGKTHAKNVFVLGQRWQYSKSSSHITGVSRDAFFITNIIRIKEKLS